MSTGLRPQAPLQRRPNETPQAFAARIDRHMRTCVGCHHTYRSVSEADECEHKHEQAALELKRLRDRQRTRPVR